VYYVLACYEIDEGCFDTHAQTHTHTMNRTERCNPISSTDIYISVDLVSHLLMMKIL